MKINMQMAPVAAPLVNQASRQRKGIKRASGHGSPPVPGQRPP